MLRFIRNTALTTTLIVVGLLIMVKQAPSAPANIGHLQKSVVQPIAIAPLPCGDGYIAVARTTDLLPLSEQALFMLQIIQHLENSDIRLADNGNVVIIVYKDPNDKFVSITADFAQHVVEIRTEDPDHDRYHTVMWDGNVTYILSSLALGKDLAPHGQMDGHPSTEVIPHDYHCPERRLPS